MNCDRPYFRLTEGALLERAPYAVGKPVVFYGSSITQGGCASRPGNAYPALLSRRLSMEYVNLGFSGNARGEGSMARHIAALNPAAFVMDYDHNAPTPEYLRETHCRLYTTIREKNPDIPYIMLSRPDFTTHPEKDSIERRRVVEDTFRYARAQGDKHVWHMYVLSRETLIRGPFEKIHEVVRIQSAEDEHLASRQEGGVQLEGRVLRRRSDEGHRTLLHIWQECILLGLIETMDLVHEQDGPSPLAPPDLGLRHDVLDVGHTSGHGGEIDEFCGRMLRDYGCEGGFSDPRGPP